MMEIVVILVLIVVAVAIVLFAANSHAKKVQNIPRLETEGVLDEVRFTSARDAQETYHFSYEVGGKPYKAWVSIYGAKGLSRTTPPGTKVVVRYNPENPIDAYIELR